MSICGTISSAQLMIEVPNTQYSTGLAPHRSDIHPPSARMTPEGKLKIAVRMPANTTVVP